MANRRLIQMLAAVLLLINLLVFLIKPGGESFTLIFGDLFTTFCALLACIGLNAAQNSFKTVDMANRAWFYVLIGVILLFLAEFTYAVLELGLEMDMDKVFPSLADFFYVLAYVPIAAGLSFFLAGFFRSGLSLERWKPLLATLTVVMAIGIAAAGWLVFVPILADEETSVLAKAVYLYYPAADLIVSGLSVMLFLLASLMGRGAFSRPWRYMAFGFLFLTAGDILYIYFNWTSEYSTGSVTDFGWNVAYLLIAIAGFSQKEIMESMDE